MGFIFEILLECALDLITDGGVEVLTNSENSRNWSKGVKIALVSITLLIFLAVIVLLGFFGISFLIEGKVLEGVLLCALAVLFIVFPIVKLREAYRKRSKDQ